MNTKTEVALKGIKEMDREVTAWESRLNSIKSDVENLKRVKEAGEREMAQIRTMATNEAGQKLLQARQEMAKVEESQALLNTQKAEFMKEMTAFQQERNAFERDKTDTLMMKKNYEESRAKLGQFITLFRRESEKL